MGGGGVGGGGVGGGGGGVGGGGVGGGGVGGGGVGGGGGPGGGGAVKNTVAKLVCNKSQQYKPPCHRDEVDCHTTKRQTPHRWQDNQCRLLAWLSLLCRHTFAAAVAADAGSGEGMEQEQCQAGAMPPHDVTTCV